MPLKPSTSSSESTSTSSFTPKAATGDMDAAPGFRKIGDHHTTAARRRLVVLVQGPTKTGRSHFALTAPGPIYYQGVDVGKEIIEKANAPWSGKDIYLADYDLSFPASADDDLRSQMAEKMWNRYVVNQYEAVKKARTAIIDTESDLWEMFRLARTGRANPEKQSYLVISPEYQGVLRSFYSSNCNLIMIERLKEEWKNNKSTGNMKRAGFNGADALAQVIIETYKRNGEYGIRVLDCRMNTGIEGMELPGCDFETLAQMIYPDSEESEWR